MLLVCQIRLQYWLRTLKIGISFDPFATVFKVDTQKPPPPRPLRLPMSDLDVDDSKIVFESSEQVEVLSTFDERFLKDELLRGIHAYGASD